MKISGKLTIALLIASMAFGFIGCKGEPPEPPKEVGVADVLNKIEVSVASFELANPDFLDGTGKAARPIEGQDEVAVLRLKIKNGSGAEVNYKPLHLEGAKNRVQLCTDPNPDTGARTNFKAIAFDSSQNFHTPGQHVEPRVTIPAGGEIYDDYLFEPPVTNDQIVVLVPGSIIGENKVMRFKVNPPVKVAPKPPTPINTVANIDGLEVKVTSVRKEYAILEFVDSSKNTFKYPYAYTREPVLAVRISLHNTSGEGKSYDPNHNSDVAGINLYFEKTSQQKRIKFENGIKGKGQIQGKISIKPGETKEDVYFFEPPSSNGKIEFDLSGHICGVRGIYRFDLNYAASEPPQPNLKPWAGDKNAEADDGADDGADENAPDAAADENAADENAAEDKADDGKADAAEKADDAEKAE